MFVFVPFPKSRASVAPASIKICFSFNRTTAELLCAIFIFNPVTECMVFTLSKWRKENELWGKVKAIAIADLEGDWFVVCIEEPLVPASVCCIAFQAVLGCCVEETSFVSLTVSFHFISIVTPHVTCPVAVADICHCQWITTLCNNHDLSSIHTIPKVACSSCKS